MALLAALQMARQMALLAAPQTALPMALLAALQTALPMALPWPPQSPHTLRQPPAAQALQQPFQQALQIKRPHTPQMALHRAMQQAARRALLPAPPQAPQHTRLRAAQTPTAPQGRLRAPKPARPRAGADVKGAAPRRARSACAYCFFSFQFLPP
jgi:hypothetical protein